MLLATLFLFVAKIPLFAQAISRVPSINTLAGDGTAGYSGDSAAATGAELNSPSGIAIDSVGNLYIADTANNRIRRVALGTGVISTFAGTGIAGYTGNGGAAASAQLQAPAGIAIDAAGNLYIADQGNNVIRKVNSAGVISTVAGNNEEGFSGDNGPATSATLYAPAGVSVDSTGDLYIADAGNNRIREVNVTGIITTIAGTGTAGFSGDNGPASGATLNHPSAIVAGGMGSLYVVDTGNDAIRLISAAGTITTIAGTGNAGYSGDGALATSATLNGPSGLAIDSAGDLYIADSANAVIRFINSAGIITTIAGNGTVGFMGDGGPALASALNDPASVALDSQGSLYLSDSGNNRIREIATPTGSVLFPATQVAAISAMVTIPLQVNAEGTTITGITVPASQGNKQEYNVATSGCNLNMPLSAGALCNVTVSFSPAYPGLRPVPLEIATSAGTINFGMIGTGVAPLVSLSPAIATPLQNTLNESYPGLAIDSAGNLYTADGNSISKIDPSTGATTGFPVGNTFDTTRNFGLAVDSAGAVYFANPGASCVFKIAPGATAPTVAAGVNCYDGVIGGDAGYSGDNGPAINAQLNGPYNVALDSADNLYIADTGNRLIRKVSASTGIITTVAGGGQGGFSGDNGPATSASLSPYSVAVDAAGNLYIDDYGNGRIRKVTAATGIINTVAGDGGYDTTGDGGPATSASLGSVYDLKVDSAGDIYLSDVMSNSIRLVNAAGTISTIAHVSGIQMAIDGLGNLYVDYGNVMQMVNVSASALTFPGAQIGSTITQNVAVTNVGNAPLAFIVPTSGQNPTISAAFAFDSSSTCPQLTAGSSASGLASGTSCSLSISFVPGSATTVTGTASITDNALNTAQEQTIQLSGGAGSTVATTTTINVSTPVFGQTQVSVTLLATAGTLVPVGSVVFTVDGTVEPPVAVSSSGTADLASGIANDLAVGSHIIAATYTSSSLGFGNSNATRIFTVSPLPPTVTIAPGSTALTVAPGGSVTDTITISSAGGYAATLQFSCANLPANASCTFQPATVVVSGTSGPQTTVATIQTAGSTAHLLQEPGSKGGVPMPAAAFWIPGLFVATLSTRRRKIVDRNFGVVALLFLLMGGLVLAGCGGSAPSPTQTPPPPVTPAGTSAVKITATNAGSVVQSFTVTLTVQ